MTILDAYLDKLKESPIAPLGNAVGKHRHMSDEDFDPEQLAMGIKVEMEHTDDVNIAKEIAKDHLAECATYYTRLELMEKKCQEEKQA